MFFVSTSYSQLKGKCVDEFGNGIAYVNISIKGTSIGTVGTVKGLFSFKNSLLKENYSLIFSHLNFEKKIIKNQLELNSIQLISKVESLKEVIDSNEKKIKEKITGSKTKTKMILVNFLSKSLGTGIGKKIEMKKIKI
ncbi:carboxypeptidase-like regulatory domain-containing protein [Psychroflexus sp. MES1-P1E]|uniref:carboxypeptidase-like regulatory domain-containing protein n=1 Tax=Psychroflexus sp. MES1-P1E TaxID=2058320 RepID=UPI0021557323|nr:carboxypeptidase-like regulatory domain-containing protein [Psychroflexus sp. MES1-P1E]